jgi:hypothetical protein
MCGAFPRGRGAGRIEQAAASPDLRQPSPFRCDLGAPRDQELGDLDTVIQDHDATTAPADLGCPGSTPLDRDFLTAAAADCLVAMFATLIDRPARPSRAPDHTRGTRRRADRRLRHDQRRLADAIDGVIVSLSASLWSTVDRRVER